MLDKNQIITETILTDKTLKSLYDKKYRLYELATPQVILYENGEYQHTIYFSDEEKELLNKINILIEHRIEQIKNI